MDTTAPELCQLLIDCLKIDSPAVDPARLSALTPEQWRDFLSLAATQRVRPLLWHRLKQKGLDHTLSTPAAESLRNAYKRNTMRNLRLYGELRQLLSALKSDEIPLILLKGIYLADAVYESIGLREMNDIDVLARPGDITRIVEILTGLGYSSPRQPAYSDNHLPPMVKNGHAAFEVHWKLVKLSESCSLDHGALWKRAVPIQLFGHDALTLTPEDLLLHLCLHVSYQHQFALGLRPFYDIAAMLTRFAPSFNWRVFMERAVQWGLQRGVYPTLWLAREFTGVDVPPDILEKLRPADMTEALLETISAQVLPDKGYASLVPVTLAELLESNHPWNKIRFFLRRIFLPKAVISKIYTVPMDSLRIYCCYPRRFFDVLHRHLHTLKKYRQNDAPLQASVARTNQIVNWLAGSTTIQK